LEWPSFGAENMREQVRQHRIAVAVVLLLCFVFNSTPSANAQAGGIAYDSLSEGKVVHGFRAKAVYLNDFDRPMGARFIHGRTGFTLDILQIQSVPQAFIWVNSLPVSDRGEPHAQEHLLVGKGNKGRQLAGNEDMSLVASNAFTQQLRTCYDFNTAAGPDVFYQEFERYMDALLHPDYTDEEVRREVRNFGITEDPATKSLRLEEKGSVYNEMTGSFTNPFNCLFRAVGQELYGPEHPLAYSSGGVPEAIREMKPEHIRQFHDQAYHLGGMGMIASVPKDMALDGVLARLDAALGRLEPDARKWHTKTEADLPRPAMAPTGDIRIVDYPSVSDQQPSPIVIAWPATLDLSQQEYGLLSLFIQNIAGDATTNLYKRFVDTKTRDVDLGAKAVFGFVSNDRGHAAMIGLVNVNAANVTRDKIQLARQTIADELARIASFKDGSPELMEFNERARNLLTQARRELSKFVNSPPGFGLRNTGSQWMTHLDDLNKIEGFRKSVVLKEQLAQGDKLLSSGRNVWRENLAKWKLIETVPYGAGARPSPGLLKQNETDRQSRAAAEIARLKTSYGVGDDQEAIRRYKADYDAATAQLDKLASESSSRFIDKPPLTLDDQLDYRSISLPGGVELVASTFDNMTSATTGVALRVDRVPDDDLTYLAILPALLTRVGVVKDGKPISYEQMTELTRKEILSLNASYSVNLTTGRDELVIRGSGNDAAESQKALEWMKLVLYSPNWLPDNLPRIRDVIDQSLAGLRNTMQGAEEGWVQDPANAYRVQDNPVMLATSSFLTQAHNVHRLRWMLKGGGPSESREQFVGLLGKLGSAGSASRSDLKALAGAIQGNAAQIAKLPDSLKPLASNAGSLNDAAKALAMDAARDLGQLLDDVPDSSLASDWAYLCKEMSHDIQAGPDKALARLNDVRQRLLKSANARFFIIGSRASQQSLEPGIRELLAGMDKAQPEAPVHAHNKIIDDRVRARIPDASAPVFVGLVNPNKQGGVFVNSAPLVTYKDTDQESLLRYVASNLFGGGGPHSVFSKTIAAGLAYSNGIGGSPSSGRLRYYAERTPELPQTLRFVIDDLKKAGRDPRLTEYAIALCFREFRSASAYEGRGEAMAADLADGLTPELISRFRTSILKLRADPKLADELYDRMAKVYATVLPGYSTKGREVPGAIYFVIGPERQLDLYEAYLKSVEGADGRLYRLYPRDFWMVAGIN
jgi:Zn-dependent M16 (insulinase) family peptidase